MKTFTVHEPAEPASDPLKRADQLVFIKEGVAWLALFFPIIWLLVQRMWLVLVLFILAAIGISMAATSLGVNQQIAAWATIALGVLLAFQANDLRRWKLDRKGYRMVAAVAGQLAGRLRAPILCRLGGPDGAGRVLLCPNWKKCRAAGKTTSTLEPTCRLMRSRATISPRPGTRARRRAAGPNERGDYRLRLGKSALGRQGLRARLHRVENQPGHQSERRPGRRCGGPPISCCRASAPLAIARRD